VWGGGGFEGREGYRDIVERSAGQRYIIVRSVGQMEFEDHCLEPWELGKVEGSLERLPII